MTRPSSPASLVAGAVLAGGASRRFGSDKAEHLVGGRTMLDVSVQALRDAGVETVSVIGRSAAAALTQHPVRAVPDRYPGAGPAPAIAHATSLSAPGMGTVVLSCDLPLIDGTTVVRLLQAYAYRSGRSVVVATCEGRDQWSASVWPAGLGLDPVRWRSASVADLAKSTSSPLIRVELGARADDADTPAELGLRLRAAAGSSVNAMQIAEIDVTQLADHLEAGGALLDVRGPGEYAEAHVPGAVLVPLDVLADRVSDVPDGSPLAVICRSGARSLQACEFLAGAGRDVVNVGGGTLRWIESGRPIETGPDES